jgi:hypothetical protein
VASPNEESLLSESEEETEKSLDIQPFRNYGLLISSKSRGPFQSDFASLEFYGVLPAKNVKEMKMVLRLWFS